MHSLRHTAISHLANDPRIPLDATRRFARHSDITIAQNYIHEVKSADVDEAMDDTMAGIG
jgi:integrase